MTADITPHVSTAAIAATRLFPIVSDSPAIARSILRSRSGSQADDKVVAKSKRTDRKVRFKRARDRCGAVCSSWAAGAYSWLAEP